MAANRILQEFYSYTDFVHSGFKYNLQVFPDTITAAALLFSLLFQSPPFIAFSSSIIFLNVVHSYIAQFFSSFIGGTIDRKDSCTGRFPGISFSRMIQLASDKQFGKLDDGGWPSYYSMFLGLIGAYAGSMPILYSQELAASPKRHVATIIGLVVLCLVILTCSTYRIIGGCDTTLSTFIGLLVGALLGLTIVVGLAWASDRRLTNILSLPLLREKAEDGKPIYVCERS